MEPSQFQVNEAWIAFRANEAPLHTPEGSFNVYVLMDAASMYIFGNALAPVGSDSPPRRETAALLRDAWVQKKEWPSKLVLPSSATGWNWIALLAKKEGIPVEYASEQELAVYVEDVRSSFEEHLNRGKDRGA